MATTPSDTVRRKLTDLGIKRLRIRAFVRTEILDADVRQLGLRVAPSGRKSFFVRTRVQGSGQQVRVTLGTFPAMGVSEARDAAREALKLAERGINPNEAKKAEKEVEATARDVLGLDHVERGDGQRRRSGAHVGSGATTIKRGVGIDAHVELIVVDLHAHDGCHE